MGKKHFLLLGVTLFFCTSCQHSTVWEDAKTTGRYLKLKTEKFLWNKETDSRIVRSEEEFNASTEEEFIPLQPQDFALQSSEFVAPQSKYSPQNRSSSRAEQFLQSSKEVAALFQRVHFNTDEHVLRNKEYYEVLHKISLFLQQHPQTCVLVEGHCDERASEAYNLALGTKRANFIRNYLIKLGVQANQLFPTSYGKERPLDLQHTEEARRINRRVEFKIFNPTL